MSGRAVASETAVTRVIVVDNDVQYDVFDVLGIADDVARVRSPYLFEIGEELTVRVEHEGGVSDAIARVRAHAGPEDARITELELLEQSASRRPVGG